jgi:hypothetical protein
VLGSPLAKAALARFAPVWPSPMPEGLLVCECGSLFVDKRAHQPRGSNAARASDNGPCRARHEPLAPLLPTVVPRGSLHSTTGETSPVLMNA